MDTFIGLYSILGNEKYVGNFVFNGGVEGGGNRPLMPSIK